MGIMVFGHMWETHYQYTEGTSKGTVLREAAVPGGAWWLSETLRAAGLDAPCANIAKGTIKREYFELIPRDKTSGSKDKALTINRYMGSLDGDNLYVPPICDKAVIWDDGPVNEAYPAFDGTVLWASKTKFPDKELIDKLSRNIIILLDADLLRQNGALISCQISWERSATDLVWQLFNNPAFRHLLSVKEIIVTFAEEGMVILDNTVSGQPVVRLYLAAGSVEGSTRSLYSAGLQNAWGYVVAAAAMELEKCSFPIIPAAFPSAAAVIQQGYNFDELLNDGGLKSAIKLLSDNYSMKSYDIPYSFAAAQADMGYWRISNSFSGVGVDELAERIVREGLKSIDGIPRITFGNLTSIDRSEIEAYQNIKNLITEYAAANAKRPLSIAVFGSPGSGKSFGVTQIAENTLPGKVVKMEFNVSQFTKKSDLSLALHKVRDTALSGKLPLVFFDEFDSDLDGRKLGWLKSFLMPMQDGKFMEGETEHPVGKCIFVFAGGTCSSFDQFSTGMKLLDNDPERLEFNNVKAPDFISRLRGTINVLGPNRVDKNDKSFLLRRALLLRSLCERNLKSCMQGSILNIDAGILAAMLLVPKYIHGARSMESIIDMCRTTGHLKWEQASLPVRTQLALHVDADAFIRLVLRDVLLGSFREQLARKIHENYRVLLKKTKASTSSIYELDWEQLTEEYKESNRAQADDIVNKLGRFGYGFDAGDSFFDTVKEFPEDKLESMAKAEHLRWMNRKMADGWTFAPGPKNEEKRTSPYLVSWDELDNEVKELDRDAVRNIIPLFEQIGLRVYKRD